MTSQQAQAVAPVKAAPKGSGAKNFLIGGVSGMIATTFVSFKQIPEIYGKYSYKNKEKFNKFQQNMALKSEKSDKNLL